MDDLSSMRYELLKYRKIKVTNNMVLDKIYIKKHRVLN